MEGSLISTADKVVDLIYLKYLKAKITFEHDRRIENFSFARDAVREAVNNTIIHNCYMFDCPIQIRIEDKEMIISNQCILPEGWTIDTFMEKHDSQPYNPDMANVFFRAGYIEHWGRGIEKICDACRELGADMPVFELRGHGLRVHFKALESAFIDESQTPNRQDVGKDVGLSDGILELIEVEPEITISRMAERICVTTRTIERAMKKLREGGRVVRVGGKRYGHWEVN